MTIRAKIKRGTHIGQDFGHFNWPDCKSPKGEQAKVDYEFDAEWTGSWWNCVRPGYGEKNNYGNGSILVFDKNGIEKV